MSYMQLIDAICRVEQAQAVLSLWLESATDDSEPQLTFLLGSIITLPDGVPEAMNEAGEAFMQLKGEYDDQQRQI
ncbi:hypothetical protein ACDA36_004124 [Klebsiella michiganensis]